MTTPSTALLLGTAATAIKSTVGSWVRANDTIGGNHGYQKLTGPGTQNSEVVIPVFLGVGTWTIGLIGTVFTDKGIVTVLLDGISKGTMDFYSSGGPTLGQKKSITGIVVTTPKRYDVTLRVATKNASSSGYAMILNALSFIRTGGTADVVTSSDYPNGVWAWTPYLGWARSAGTFSALDNSTDIMGIVDRFSVQNTYGEVDLWLPAGTYTLGIFHQKDTANGIITVKVDGVAVGTIDTYNGAGVTNQYAELTGINVPSGKLVTLRFENPTKNASSAGYLLRMNLLLMVKV